MVQRVMGMLQMRIDLIQAGAPATCWDLVNCSILNSEFNQGGVVD